MITLGFDIGSNSVGSAWFNTATGEVRLGIGVFPAGVEESDEKRGDPKNAKRRMARRSRITLARRAERKRALRLRLIEAGLLPAEFAAFKSLLEGTDPWELRRKALDQALEPHEFGRVLLHMAQRRGALGLQAIEQEDADEVAQSDDGKVKKAIGDVRKKMLDTKARSFGEFIAMERSKRVSVIATPDLRKPGDRKGPREFRGAIRNKPGKYEHCADREMIRDEFDKLWKKQKELSRPLAGILDVTLRRQELEDPRGDSLWREKGLLFGQRLQSWDLGTLGRCVLEPTDRCVPHADMYASHYLVVETVNNLKILEVGKEPRSLTPEELKKIKDYLRGPLGMEKVRKKKGDTSPPMEKPKTNVSVTDLRLLMGTSEDGWGRDGKKSRFRFNIETDEERQINTDWFSREIVHGAISIEKWNAMSDRERDGLNRAILRHDPEYAADEQALRECVTQEKKEKKTWSLGLNDAQVSALIAAWKRRPKLDAKRLNMSRRAVRNLLSLMDRKEPWNDPNRPGHHRWLTAIEARKLIAEDGEFKDVTTGKPLDEHARVRYATGAKGATARDRYYMSKHVLMKNGRPVLDLDGRPLAEPPPAPLISNPVVRKAIHEVRRHLVEFMTTFGQRPDQIYIELAREAKMGKVDADRLLFRNRTRNRIRNDIVQTFQCDGQSSTQQRSVVERVVLGVQQGGVCPLCGNQLVQTRITPKMAAEGDGCEIAHIIPRSRGGHNGLSNTVLAHTRCNREMMQQTPREFWNSRLKGGFDEGIRCVEAIYGNIERPKGSEFKNAKGDALWPCYFQRMDDQAKVLQFKKDIKDIQGMTNRQEASTRYAARQVMSYLADAVYGGKGLPERGGERTIYATDGLWTSRLRREWGLFFDRHGFKQKGLTNEQEHERKEKDRGDHRHHAVDALVIALCSRRMQIAWEERELQAERDGIRSADESAMENYRKLHPLPIPSPFKTRDELREAVKRALFGDGTIERLVCHRAVKRKLTGALHEDILFGPVLDAEGRFTDKFTAKKSVSNLDPNHLRMPRTETKEEAIERLAARRQRTHGVDEKTASKWARSVVGKAGYMPAIVDPPPGKSGLVRDVALRRRLRVCLEEAGLNPDDFNENQLKKVVDAGGLKHASGVPIHSVVLLRTMTDPVIVSRWATDHATGERRRVFDAQAGEGDSRAARAYVGGNNHHIEIRTATDARGRESWTGVVVSTYEAAQRKLARLRMLRSAGVPDMRSLAKLPPSQRSQFSQALRQAEAAHPIVDRADREKLGGRFVMSLCEGETIFMRHKSTGEPGYFVVAKLDKPNGIVVVPHWDARAAGERKDSEGRKVMDSKREQFTVKPEDLKSLGAPGQPHAMKVRVSPLGVIRMLMRD